MKKSILLFCLVVFTTMLKADDEFQLIKGTYRFVTDKPFYGEKYDGYVDANGKPYLYGKVYSKNDFAYTQIKNGVPCGWMIIYAPYGWGWDVLYAGIGRFNTSKPEIEPYGYGSLTTFLNTGKKTYTIGDVSKFETGGLAILQRDYNQKSYTYFKGTERNAPNIVYQELLYEKSKEKIKQYCLSHNIKYVENVNLQGGFTYSGGWRDGMPYDYGTFYSEGKSVFAGNFDCSKGQQGYNFTYKDNYEAYLVTHTVHNRSKTYDITIAYETRKINGTDTTYSYFDERRYEEYTVNKNNEYVSYTQINFNNASYAKILKPKSKTQTGDYWGICVDGKCLFEGYVCFENNRITPTGQGIIMYNDGAISKWLKETDNPIISYPDGSQFEVFNKHKKDDEEYFGILTAPNKNYTIGYFKSQRKPTPLYAEEYDVNNHLVNSTMVDAKWDTKKHNDAIAELKDYCSSPLKGNANFTYSNGDVYAGEWKNHKKHGQGEMTYKDDVLVSVREGLWENDHLVKGKVTYRNGNVYEGELLNDKYHGTGKMTYSIGVYYDGTWENGQFVSGKVHLQNADGEYTGECKGTKPHGEGKRIYKNGGYKDGFWKDGKFIFGNVYTVYDNGESFKGVYQYGKAESGTFTLIDNTQVSFQWKVTVNENHKVKAVRQNHVDIIYPNKNEYHGTFENDQLEGDSVIVYADGTCYKGGWKQGGRAGVGVEIFANGDSLSTTWSENLCVPDAPLTYTWSDGRKFIGVGGKKGKIGKGKYLNADGTEANKKDSKSWIMQTPTAIDITQLPKSNRDYQP